RLDRRARPFRDLAARRLLGAGSRLSPVEVRTRALRVRGDGDDQEMVQAERLVADRHRLAEEIPLLVVQDPRRRMLEEDLPIEREELLDPVSGVDLVDEQVEIRTAAVLDVEDHLVARPQDTAGLDGRVFSLAAQLDDQAGREPREELVRGELLQAAHAMDRL